MITPVLLLALTTISSPPTEMPIVHDAALTSSRAQNPLPRRGALGASFSPIPAEQAQTLGIKAGQGVVVVSVTKDLTAEKAGLRPGDILVEINSKPVLQPTVGTIIRDIPSGGEVEFMIFRGSASMTLKTKLVEKPRDPGNANYTVTYTHIVSNGHRMRTIITKPTRPGKHPSLFFIQGFSPLSYDYKLEGTPNTVQSLGAPILFEFANSGYVTLRIEKPGVGDSEGGPFADLDYTTELDIYRQALKQLKDQKEVDPEKVFIFGHSMGGAFGPMIGAESPVRGIATYGTAARTWHEYLLDTVRYQGLVGGGTYEQADESVRQGARLITAVFLENQSPADVKRAKPELAPLIDGMFPGGLFNGKSLDFWRQLGQINFPSQWLKCKTHVLAIRGKSDFVTYDVDHQLIADAVNRARPGTAKVLFPPSLDHVFNDWPTESESMKNWPNGKFNPSISGILKEWTTEVLAKPKIN